MRTKLLSLIAAILLASILSGCGGSSSSGQSVSTGVYKDAGIVSGLQYSTPTQSGITDSNGSFKYKPGESVTFSVSNVTIGQATGAPIITTFDLVGITPPTSSFGIPTNNPSSKKFQEAVNISLFLQTLDDDSDPTNGIAIPAVVNSVVALMPLNFKMTNMGLAFGNWNNFQDSPQFKVFVGSCRSAGAWGGTKAIKQLGYAANSLYHGFGITPSVYLPQQISNSGGGVTRYEYDSSGLTYKELRYDSSYTLINQWTYTYNSDGSLKTMAYVYAPDPSSATSTNNVYDANGNLISATYKTDQGTEETVFEYDINGNQTRRTTYFNGAISWYTVNTYNASGLLTTEKIYNRDHQLTSTSTYEYNESLFVTAQIWSDGFNSSSTIVEYNKDNYFTKITTSSSGNTDVEEFAYDAFGNIIAAVGYRNGVIEGKYVFTWDSNGYLTNTNFYDLEDHLAVATVATYDSHGSRIRVVRTYGDIEDTTTTSYIGQDGWGGLLGRYWYLFFYGV